mmetsp:Transcript_54123/g.88328  ORF Transcript_54123/g.88328 Transcript_54123/m.88328 type:complete len:209 (-) Transcript_54123:277-903(-)
MPPTNSTCPSIPRHGQSPLRSEDFYLEEWKRSPAARTKNPPAARLEPPLVHQEGIHHTSHISATKPSGPSAPRPGPFQLRNLHSSRRGRQEEGFDRQEWCHPLPQGVGRISATKPSGPSAPRPGPFQLRNLHSSRRGRQEEGFDRQEWCHLLPQGVGPVSVQSTMRPSAALLRMSQLRNPRSKRGRGVSKSLLRLVNRHCAGPSTTRP